MLCFLVQNYLKFTKVILLTLSLMVNSIFINKYVGFGIALQLHNNEFIDGYVINDDKYSYIMFQVSMIYSTICING